MYRNKIGIAPEPPPSPALSEAEAVARAITRARHAQKEFGAAGPQSRGNHVLKIRGFLFEHAEEIADIICQDTGKTSTEALTAEVIPSILACDWYRQNTENILKPKKLSGHWFFTTKTTVQHHQPLGVVAVISPWNYPLAIPFAEVIMGLMAGNAIILKASPETPKVNEMIDRIIAAGDLPDGVYSRIDGDGPKIGDALFANHVDKIFFTGSTNVGKQIAARAAESLTPVSLELGGNDAMLVLADCDIERATNGALWAAFQNAGQTCASVERIYVHQSIYGKFVELLAEKTRKLRHGNSDPELSDFGSLTTAAQFQKVKTQIDQAQKLGAKIVAQSTPAPSASDQALPATVLTEVTQEMAVLSEETFGPVVSVLAFNDLSDGIAKVNDDRYGLTCSIWTQNTKLGRQIAEGIATGVVTINDHLYTHAMSEAPWGGVKNTGLGRTHGEAGLKEMTELKVISWEALAARRQLYWYPAKGTLPMIRSLLVAVGGSSWPKRLQALLRLALPAAIKMATRWK